MPPRQSAPSSQAAPVVIPFEVKQAFIQDMMSSCVRTEASAKNKLFRISGLDSDAVYAEVLSQANQDMAFAGLQLKTLKFPLDGARYLGLINKEADATSKLGSLYSPQQCEFFKAVVERLARASPGPMGSASEVELLNLEIARVPVPAAAENQAGPSTQAGPSSQAAGAGSPTAAAAQKPLSKKDRASTVHQLLAESWIASANRPNHYCLGPRTLLELGEFLSGLDDLPEETKAAFDDIL